MLFYDWLLPEVRQEDVKLRKIGVLLEDADPSSVESRSNRVNTPLRADYHVGEDGGVRGRIYSL
jgi:hypothetical protein